jgi:hypothetical protein
MLLSTLRYVGQLIVTTPGVFVLVTAAGALIGLAIVALQTR